MAVPMPRSVELVLSQYQYCHSQICSVHIDIFVNNDLITQWTSWIVRSLWSTKITHDPVSHWTHDSDCKPTQHKVATRFFAVFPDVDRSISIHNMSFSCTIRLARPIISHSVADRDPLSSLNRRVHSSEARCPQRWSRSEPHPSERKTLMPLPILLYPMSSRPRKSAQCAEERR